MNRWRRWWSGTLGRRPSTGWPIRCSQRHLWRRRDAIERANRAAAAGGDGSEVWLADARHAGGAPADAGRRRHATRPSAKRPKTARRELAIFTALRGGMQQLVDALVARLDPASLRTATPVSAIREDGQRLECGRRAGAAGIMTRLIMAAPAWAAGELLAPVDRSAGR